MSVSHFLSQGRAYSQGMAYSSHSGHGRVMEKGTSCLLIPPKQMVFLIILKENIL